MVRVGFSAEYGSWWIIWMRRKYGARSFGLSAVIDWPSMIEVAAVEVLEAAQDAAEGGLAAAGLADERDRAAVGDREVDSAQSAARPARRAGRPGRRRYW